MADTQPKWMTRAGHARIVAESEQLFRVERPEVVRRVADAAAEGDRSENAEYIYGRKRLREIDKRLQYLGNLIKGAKIVDPPRVVGDRVVFGTVVVVEDEKGEQHRWQIVGEGEADPRGGSISYRSPVGRALLDRRVGDVVEVELPERDAEFEVLEIAASDAVGKEP